MARDDCRKCEFFRLFVSRKLAMCVLMPDRTLKLCDGPMVPPMDCPPTLGRFQCPCCGAIHQDMPCKTLV